MIGELPALEWLLRLGVAALLSGLIGFEREARQKAAGLRTHMLIGLGACLFALISGAAFEGGDPTRIASQIVTGVGFLGAGAIFREGANVRGLTTAAGIWAVAAIGTTIGTGLIGGAVIATVIAVAILSGLPLIDRMVRDRRGIPRVSVVGITLEEVEVLPRVLTLVAAFDDVRGEISLRQIGADRYQADVPVLTRHVPNVLAAVSGVAGVTAAVDLGTE